MCDDPSPRQQRLFDGAVTQGRARRTRRGDRFTPGDLLRMPVQTLGCKTRLVLAAGGGGVLAVGLGAIIGLRSDCFGLGAVTVGLIGLGTALTGHKRTAAEVAERIGPEAAEALVDAVFEAQGGSEGKSEAF